MRKALAVLLFLFSAGVFAQGRQFATELREAAGPPVTVGDILAARRAVHPQVIVLSVSNDQFLLPAAINAPGKNGTFFKTDFFITNSRLIDQQVLIAWLPQGVSAAGLVPARYNLTANTVYLLNDFLSPAAGNLNQTGVGSLLVTGVFTGTNTIDSNALLEGSDRIWTFEPGSSGTNSFTMEGQQGDVFGTSTATSIGSRQDVSFRSNVGIVNLDSSFSHTWTVRVAGSGQSSTFTVTVPPQSMVQVAVPTSFAPGSFFAEFTPDAGMAGELWSAYAVTADNITGDAWVSRATQP